MTVTNTAPELEQLIRQYTNELLKLQQQQPTPLPDALPATEPPALSPEDGADEANRDAPPTEDAPEEEMVIIEDTPMTLDEPPIPTTPPLQEYGRLQVQVYRAEEALPVEGATVTVFAEDGGGALTPLTVTTNRSGFTPAITLPAKPAALSMSPGNPRPYATYTVQVNAPGYFEIRDSEVAVYSGVTSVLPAALLPLPENFTGDPIITYPGGQPNL